VPEYLALLIDRIEAEKLSDRAILKEIKLLMKILETHACRRALGHLKIDPATLIPWSKAGNLRGGNTGRICPNPAESPPLGCLTPARGPPSLQRSTFNVQRSTFDVRCSMFLPPCCGASMTVAFHPLPRRLNRNPPQKSKNQTIINPTLLQVRYIPL
jgi:hypothetical protein